MKANDNCQFLALHTMRVRGFPATEAVAEVLGVRADEAGAILASLEAAGLCGYLDGRITGWRLTNAGKERHAADVSKVFGGRRTANALEAAYATFEPLNATFKAVCTDWQLRDGAPNDHTNKLYDERVVRRLGECHVPTIALLSELSTVVPHYGGYANRLELALVRVRSGDLEAVARPLSGSYHDVWMEIHQDLILSLGRVRTAADA